MLTPRRAAILALLLPGSVAAQDNPFALTGGSVKTAYIVYEVSAQKQQPGAAPTSELGVAADQMIMRMVMPLEASGKKDTLRSFVVATKDSQYTYNKMGGQEAGEVSALLRPHLAREYAALDASGKARFRENLRLATELGGGSDADAYVTRLRGAGWFGDHRRPEVQRLQDEEGQCLRHAGGSHGHAPVGRSQPRGDPGRQEGHPERSDAAGIGCHAQGRELEED